MPTATQKPTTAAPTTAPEEGWSLTVIIAGVSAAIGLAILAVMVLVYLVRKRPAYRRVPDVEMEEVSLVAVRSLLTLTATAARTADIACHPAFVAPPHSC